MDQVCEAQLLWTVAQDQAIDEIRKLDTWIEVCQSLRIPVEIEMKLIPIDKIQTNKVLRPGPNRLTADELTAKIKKLNPITVAWMKNGEYFLLDGLRRVEACKQVGITEIMARITTQGDDHDTD